MQEIHSIGGGRFIGGGGERRLRPHHHHHNNNPNHPALKCPRCDSFNTKFCYYNNYNLSQPRHFCKSCRRYWTNGGVLRNVPVGGGCRKSKRSKPKNSTSSETAAAPPSSPKAPAQSQPEHERKSNSHSSSESFSTLTATATATPTATEAVSAPSSNSASDNLLDNIHESKFFIHPSSTSNPSFEPGMLEQGGDSGIFSEIGNLTSLMTSTNEALAFGYGNISDTLSFQFSSAPQGNDPHSQMNMGDDHQELKFPTSLIDQTVGVDLSVEQNKMGHGGYGSLDWQGSTDQGLFDLPNTVDQAYWSHSQWTDQGNPSLFHHLP